MMKPEFPLKSFKVIMSFQGMDFITCVIDSADKKFFVVWVDVDKGIHTSAVFHVTEDSYQGFREEKVSFLTLWKDAPAIYLLTSTEIGAIEDATAESLVEVSIDVLEQQHYLPNPTAFFMEYFEPEEPEFIEIRKLH